MCYILERIQKRYDIPVRSNTRHDLCILDRKISGSASRIIRTGNELYHFKVPSPEKEYIFKHGDMGHTKVTRNIIIYV